MIDDQLKQLLRKYSVAQALPEGSAEAAMRFKRPGLQKLLRNVGKFSFFAFITSTLYFAAKKAGISVSLLKINLITIGIIAGSAVAVTSGAAYVVLNRSAAVTRDSLSRDQVPPFPRLKNRPVQVVSPQFIIMPFRHDDESAEVASILAQRLHSDLNASWGTDTAMIARSAASPDSSVGQIAGSVVRADSGFIVTVRVVNPDAEVVFFEKQRIESKRDIPELVRKLRFALTD